MGLLACFANFLLYRCVVPSLVLGVEVLIIEKEHGVDKIFWLEENVVVDVTQKNIVFLARCTVKNALAIAGTLPELHEEVSPLSAPPLSPRMGHKVGCTMISHIVLSVLLPRSTMS